MDRDDEIDKILKQKFENKILPSEEFENNMKKIINEQKSKKNKKYKKIITITSIAAVFVIIFALGMNFMKFDSTQIQTISITKIEPTKISDQILSEDSEFIIYTDKDANIESVKKSLYIEPALEYSIEKTGKDGQYKLKFKQNIPDNTIVKLQYVKDKITKDSWAYQTSNKLSVTNTYPVNMSNQVLTSSNIEIEMSYSNIENFEKYVQIVPEVEGTWEQKGKVYKFIPSNGLVDQTQYTVTVKKGLKIYDQELEDNYTFSFSVNNDTGITEKYENISNSIDNINTYNSNENISIYYQTNGNIEIANVEIGKFDSSDSFIEYLQTKDYSKATDLQKVDFNLIENGIKLTRTLQDGYYVAIIKNKNGSELFNTPIQINNLNVYVTNTENDILVWVADENGIASNIKVKYESEEKVTNSEGIAKFTSDKTEMIKYLKIGNTENKLIVGVYNYNKELYYSNSYIYTDRTLYKNTDTINIWGFVPKAIYGNDLQDEFYISFNGESKEKINVGKDGNYNYKIELQNHYDVEYAMISLYYKDKEIAGRYVTIENYELQNYTYEIIANKNYVYNNEKYDFDVKVTHITGLVVPNKKVLVRFNGQELLEKTDENGIAHFSVDIAKEDEKTYIVTNMYMEVYNGDLEEYNDTVTTKDVELIYRDIYTTVNNTGSNYELSAYKLQKDKEMEVSYDLKELYDDEYNTTVEIDLKESRNEKKVVKYELDKYTKTNKPVYDYVITENTQKITEINMKNGKMNYDINSLKMKDNTEVYSYTYTLIFKLQDRSGKEIEIKKIIYRDEKDVELGYSYGFFSNLGRLAYKQNISYYYDIFRYFLKADVTNFNIGDTAKFTLSESIANKGNQEIDNNGKLLLISAQENILTTKITDKNEIEYKFEEKDFPGCKITSAYYYNGKFYRMPIYYYDFNEETRKVDIDIKSDKTEYKPGDEVNLTIKTTNNNKPIKTFVNISVVNEAVFAVQEDSTEIVSTIYQDPEYPIYTYSSYFDFISKEPDGFGGGGGDTRGNFGDTAYFDTVYTDSNGVANVKFKLPDNVTTYRVTVHSANEELYVGVNKIDITSKLDFFIQSTEPRNVKTTDDLVLNATSIASEQYNVKYQFTIEELNKTLEAEETTNSITTVNFGKLDYGTYHVVIRGSGNNQEDAITYPINIIESAQEVKKYTKININETPEIKPTKNPIVLEIYNRNMEKYIDYIDFIENTLTERLDTQIAYNEIQKIRTKYYGSSNNQVNINMAKYRDTKNYTDYLKNLENANTDIVLTALIQYYAKDYISGLNIDPFINDDNNLFEQYLLASANKKTVLTDLLQLKEEKDIENYNKLLVTLSLEFLGDYQNAKDLYNQIELNSEEKEEYKSITAIIETFINKENSSKIIDKLIANSPEDEYLRFAILSFFQNNETDISNEEEIKIISSNINETIKLNGMSVKSYIINNKDLDIIKFETNSNNIVVRYYYQTLLENIESENISEDMSIKITGNLKKNSTIYLQINCNDTEAKELRIALPNSLRLANTENLKGYWIMNNAIDYISVYKQKGYSSIKIPLIVTLDGNYKFENIVNNQNGIYHISNSLDLDIK